MLILLGTLDLWAGLQVYDRAGELQMYDGNSNIRLCRAFAFR